MARTRSVAPNLPHLPLSFTRPGGKARSEQPVSLEEFRLQWSREDFAVSSSDVRILLALLLFRMPPTFAAEPDIPVVLPNLQRPQDNRIVSGAIDAKEIGRLRAAGVKHVINLRTEQESQGLNEAQIASGLGMVYHAIPIEGAPSLTRENARKLDEALAHAGDELTLVHCASGNRVGALIAVREFYIRGRSVEERWL
jgi:protein tyrosine phosphatase (PTP) superfamily phosphohydrolase (DUF442 family)